MSAKHTLTPHQTVKKLDQYIIGQDDAKKIIAIALRDRYRRLKAKKSISEEIVPSNILMIGPTGTGKTELARRMAHLCNVPFVKVNATDYTETGYVGKSVGTIIEDLAEKALNIVKRQKIKEVEDKIRQDVNKIILDIVIPPVQSTNQEDNQKTRELFLERIEKGELDERSVEIEVQDRPPSGIGMISGGMVDEAMLASFNNMIKNIMPVKTKVKKVKIKEAKELLFQLHMEPHLDAQVLQPEVKRLAERGIVFIDEVDKIVGSTKESGGPEVSRKGVQNNLLPIVEGTAVKTQKAGNIKTDSILFITAGAFHYNKPNDLMPEFLGRFPLWVWLNSLTKEDYARILSHTKNSIIKQQTALLDSEKIKLEFTKDSITEMANAAYILNKEKENIGARRLQTVMMHVLRDILYDVPDKILPGTKIVIDAQVVRDRLKKVLDTEKTTNYIL